MATLVKIDLEDVGAMLREGEDGVIAQLVAFVQF